jgi:hypothetical protein
MNKDGALLSLMYFCNSNPLNYYECLMCGQYDKHHENVNETLEQEKCFRCGGDWIIRENTEMRLPGYLDICIQEFELENVKE